MYFVASFTVACFSCLFRLLLSSLQKGRRRRRMKCEFKGIEKGASLLASFLLEKIEKGLFANNNGIIFRRRTSFPFPISASVTEGRKTNFWLPGFSAEKSFPPFFWGNLFFLGRAWQRRSNSAQTTEKSRSGALVTLSPPPFLSSFLFCVTRV